MDFTNIELFYNLYFYLPPEMAYNSLACLVQLSAVRRSFFNNNERMKYLNELCIGVKKILETSAVIFFILNILFSSFACCPNNFINVKN
jgi:hypothetical protein